MHSKKRWLASLVVVSALLLAACGNSGDETSTDTTAAPDDSTDTEPDTGDGSFDENVPVDAPGVSDDAIRVGGVASVTNPINGNYGDVFDGANAYLEMINDEGGVWGREIQLVAEKDDNFAANQEAVNELIVQEDVFAVLPVATLNFAGAVDLVAEGTPTFGWNIQKEWSDGPNMYGEKGSFICFTCTSPVWPWVAEQLGADSVGILAYGVSAQSQDAAAGYRKSFEELSDIEVGFFDDSLNYGVPDMSGEVAAMKEAGVDLVFTAMDQNGVVTLQREIEKQGLDAVQSLPNAYDPTFVEEFGELFEGSYVGIQFWPFEEDTDRPEGSADYLEWMENTGGKVNEISMAGWLATDLFIEGLKAAGPEFSQQKVVDAINQMTDWTAHGANAGFDWTIAHEQEQDTTCFAIMEITADAFVPSFGEPGKPFMCLDNTVTDHVPEAEFRG